MPQELSFALDKEYELKNDGTDIKLDVTIGDLGQSPDISVKLNTKKLLTNGKQSVKGLLVGNDKNLDGGVLRINGNITDTTRDSNKISLTLKVSGGVANLTKKFSVTVDDEGEVVIFSLIVRFFA
jgi:carbon monoxide dehydrogenase subunit G